MLPSRRANCEVIFIPLELSSQVLSISVCKIIETSQIWLFCSNIYIELLCALHTEHYIVSKKMAPVLFLQ